VTYDALDIFRQALAFEDAAGALQDRLAGGPVNDTTPASQTISVSPTDLPKLCPQIVLDAFCIELYLKCIATIETGKTPRGHDLWSELFVPLTPESRRRITNHYKDVLAATSVPALNIEDALQQSAGAFESFRYLYERSLDRALVVFGGNGCHRREANDS